MNECQERDRLRQKFRRQTIEYVTQVNSTDIASAGNVEAFMEEREKLDKTEQAWRQAMMEYENHRVGHGC